MMEDATPIYQLQQSNTQQPSMIQDSRKEPLEMMSYTDILKNMSDTSTTAPKPIVQQPTTQPPQKYPPVAMMEHPQQQQHPMQNGGFPGLAYHPQNRPHTSSPTHKDTSKNRTDDVTFQNEMLALLGVYIMVHTSQFQNTLRLKVPGIFHESGSPSVVGTLVNGVLVIVLWNIFKKFLLKYMKDL
jgi:hypothetical protein